MSFSTRLRPSSTAVSISPKASAPMMKENAARGIDRFTANPAAKGAFGQRVSSVRIVISDKPYIKVDNRVLIVTFNPHTGYFGRASSNAISFALGKLFGVPSN